MKRTISLFALITAFPAFSEDSRQLDTHEHGVGTLKIAIDGKAVEMAFEAPGADIVGFEYVAEKDADLAAVDAAVTTLTAPLNLFVVPDAAGCSVIDAQVELEGKDEHDDHGDEGHDDHGDEDHSDEASHTEFHAEYTLTCENPEALTKIIFAYFETFPNAQEVETQIITATGARAFEVERDEPVLDLER